MTSPCWTAAHLQNKSHPFCQAASEYIWIVLRAICFLVYESTSWWLSWLISHKMASVCINQDGITEILAFMICFIHTSKKLPRILSLSINKTTRSHQTNEKFVIPYYSKGNSGGRNQERDQRLGISIPVIRSGMHLLTSREFSPCHSGIGTFQK